MSTESSLIDVKIFARTYKIKCPTQQKRALFEAAAHVDQLMQTLSLTEHRPIQLERLAIITALNLSHELLSLKKQLKQEEQINQRLQALQERMDHVLVPPE